MRRRLFLSLPVLATVGAWTHGGRAGEGEARPNTRRPARRRRHPHNIHLFVCGDVMTGRGIDQIFPQPSSPELYEPYMSSALHYVKIAERANGRIPRAVDFAYPWGDALAVLEQTQPDLSVINLETAVTTSDAHWLGKGIHYRMHPANTACLSAARIDCCALANNHVLDWGYAGLRETVHTLHKAGIQSAGAGDHLAQAAAPAIFDLDGQRRVIVFSMGLGSSGIGRAWAAGPHNPGVWRLADLSAASVVAVAARVQAVKRPGDVVIASIHWGSNWGYEIDRQQRRFAHALIDRAGVDLLHGHSSHHPRGVERYAGKLILYGCGDFINDYEGIGGYEAFRGDLVLMYLPVLDARDGSLVQLTMYPMQMHRFRLRHASEHDSRWLAEVMDRESSKLDTRIIFEEGLLRLMV